MCSQIISVVFCFNPDNFNAFDLLLGYGLYECAQLRKAHVAIDADTNCTHTQAHTLEPTNCYQCQCLSLFAFTYIYVYIYFVLSVTKELFVMLAFCRYVASIHIRHCWCLKKRGALSVLSYGIVLCYLFVTFMQTVCNYSFIIVLSVLRQVRSLFHSDPSTQWGPVLPLSIPSTLSFP